MKIISHRYHSDNVITMAWFQSDHIQVAFTLAKTWKEWKEDILYKWFIHTWEGNIESTMSTRWFNLFFQNISVEMFFKNDHWNHSHEKAGNKNVDALIRRGNLKKNIRQFS